MKEDNFTVDVFNRDQESLGATVDLVIPPEIRDD